MVTRDLNRFSFSFSFQILLCLLFTQQSYIQASNWAQASGSIQQNIVVPYYAAPDTPHWTGRYGASVASTSASNLSSYSYVYFMGGDSYDGKDATTYDQPGLADTRWENGYKNDVWRMTGTEWSVHSDIRLKTVYGRKIPRVESKLKWSKVINGLHPPRGTTNDEWIKCESPFRNRLSENETLDCEANPRTVQWSPRRHHASVTFNGYLWIFGGRAREYVDLPETRSIGGIIGPRIQDLPDTTANSGQSFTTQREASILKSDVWRSADGATWTLISPGCKAPQLSLIASGNKKEGKFGIKEYACTLDTDCYGSEKCSTTKFTCYCPYWSPREQHAVATYGGYIYLSGGYASRLYSEFSNCGAYACGDTDPSAYRYYLSDIWRSSDGATWDLITENAFSLSDGTLLGRGGHQMLAILSANSVPYLWVVGGRGGDNTYSGGDEIYYNDIWTAPLTGQPVTWTLMTVNDTRGNNQSTMPWAGRTGHGVVLEEGTSDNLNTRTLYLYGGYNNGTFYDDVWSWRIDDSTEYWKQDFTPSEYFASGDGDYFHYSNNSPTAYYVTPDLDVTYLRRFWVPTNPDTVTGKRYEERPYLTSAKVAMLNEVGITTIRDLANADLYTILKLRGFDFPQVTTRLDFTDVCDFRALAIAVVDKCTINLPALYDGEKQMPWNVVPDFGGAPPFTDNVKWHGRKNYNFLKDSVDDVTVLTADWNGCDYVTEIEGLFGPNVNGLGYVDQVKTIRDPAFEIENLFCRQAPGARAFHSMIFFEGRVYAMGGKQSTDTFYADTWYRDPKLPQTTITKGPSSRTPDRWFQFTSDKAGSHFEYRVWDPYNFKEIRGWTKVVRKASVAWLNWRKGGPGTGRYQLYVRAIDPSGNSDERFVLGQNVYNWYYVSPTPWDIIFGVIGAFIGLCILLYMEYRRRVKKAAMERYAMKRMRRKFKAMQRDVDGKAVDWRTLYLESKEAEEKGFKDKKKKLKKVRDKNAEKREKEKKKREKEKELIKKKLRANKDFKDKSKSSKSALSSKLDKSAKSKDSSKTSKKPPNSKVVPALPGVVEEDEIDEEMGMGAEKEKNYPRSKSFKLGQKSTKVAVATDGLSGKDEISADILPSSKNTELGFKQRKVNKRLKSYENEGGDEEEGEEKENDKKDKKA